MPQLGLTQPAIRLRAVPISEWLKRGAFWLLLIASLVLCFRAKGHHAQWVGLAVLVPILRMIFEPAYRAALRLRIAGYVQELADFPNKNTKIPWQAVLALVVLPTAILNLANSRSLTTGDSWPVLATASNFVLEGNANLADYLSSAPSTYFLGSPLPYCVIPVDSGVYSVYPAGMTLFATPVCAVSRALNADLPSHKVRMRLEKWTAAWLGAMCLGLFMPIALRLTDLKTAAITTLLLATGSAMITTVGNGLWQHGGVIFWALLALNLEFYARQKADRPITLLVGICLGMMLSCRLSAGFIVATMGIWIASRSLRRGLILTVGVALGYLPWALYYFSIYNSPLGPGAAQMAKNNWGGGCYYEVLFSPGAGMFVYQPWIALALFLPFVRRLDQKTESQSDTAGPPGLKWVCLSIIVLQVTLIAHWNCWWGGDCWGSRLMTEALPFAALLCLQPINSLRNRRWGLVLLGALFLISAYLHVYTAYVRFGFSRPEETLLDWTQPPFITWQRS